MTIEPPAQRFRVAFAAVDCHERASALLHLDKAHRLEGTHRLADAYAGASEQLPEFSLGRKSIARSVVTVPDGVLELPAHLLGAVDALYCRERQCSLLLHGFSRAPTRGSRISGGEASSR
jgi:hypothetical protein